MPLARFFQPLSSTCRYCGRKASVLRRSHQECEEAHRAGWQEMVSLVTRTATDHSFNESALQQSLSAIAHRSHATDEDIERALEEGWKHGVAHAMSDGIISREEEERLRAFRDHLTLEDNAADADAIWDLDQASGQRLMLEARLAAISVQDGNGHLRDLEDALQEARMDFHQRRRVLIRAWEAAVEGALEDGLLSLDEENALAKYAAHFGLEQHDLDGNGVQTSLVQAAVIRDVTRGIVPQRQRVNGAVPFNLMKSEQLVWVIQGVDYLETVVRRERRSHLPRCQYPGGKRTLLQPSPVPEPAHRVGRDDTRGYRPAGAHDQAPVLRRGEEEVQGPVRQDRELRALRGRVRDHA